ncbi:putative DUF5667 domain-containing protein [Frankia sp. AiPs1]|uniref:DUF5667 domain-containing protein n=1 Tax=Frankia sp. AiPa1 TaxID=573492 RepID=UPI00202B3DB6|nr:DUF5667 domain-containing protein [Frankia sp. AiPa1]MCL9762341.1 DUF5667 domain-containing protein [Frankia sp. AiPa1]
MRAVRGRDREPDGEMPPADRDTRGRRWYPRRPRTACLPARGSLDACAPSPLTGRRLIVQRLTSRRLASRQLTGRRFLGHRPVGRAAADHLAAVLDGSIPASGPQETRILALVDTARDLPRPQLDPASREAMRAQLLAALANVALADPIPTGQAPVPGAGSTSHPRLVGPRDRPPYAGVRHPRSYWSRRPRAGRHPIAVPRVARALLAAGLSVTVAVIALALSARDALPGEPLYSVKRRVENLQVSLERDPVARAKTRLDVAGVRMSELRSITGGGPPGRADGQSATPGHRRTRSAGPNPTPGPGSSATSGRPAAADEGTIPPGGLPAALSARPRPRSAPPASVPFLPVPFPSAPRRSAPPPSAPVDAMATAGPPGPLRLPSPTGISAAPLTPPPSASPPPAAPPPAPESPASALPAGAGHRASAERPPDATTVNNLLWAWCTQAHAASQVLLARADAGNLDAWRTMASFTASQARSLSSILIELPPGTKGAARAALGLISEFRRELGPNPPDSVRTHDGHSHTGRSAPDHSLLGSGPASPGHHTTPDLDAPDLDAPARGGPADSLPSGPPTPAPSASAPSIAAPSALAVPASSRPPVPGSGGGAATANPSAPASQTATAPPSATAGAPTGDAPGVDASRATGPSSVGRPSAPAGSARAAGTPAKTVTPPTGTARSAADSPARAAATAGPSATDGTSSAPASTATPGSDPATAPPMSAAPTASPTPTAHPARTASTELAASDTPVTGATEAAAASSPPATNLAAGVADTTRITGATDAGAEPTGTQAAMTSSPTDAPESGQRDGTGPGR